MAMQGGGRRWESAFGMHVLQLSCGWTGLLKYGALN